MNAEHVYRVASTAWLHCHGHQVEEVPAWPNLTHRALVVLDLAMPHDSDDSVRVISSTRVVPKRLSWRETIGPAIAMPTENAASTMPADV